MEEIFRHMDLDRHGDINRKLPHWFAAQCWMLWPALDMLSIKQSWAAAKNKRRARGSIITLSRRLESVGDAAAEEG